MKNWFIKNIIRILEKLEVGKLPVSDRNKEYYYFSTQNANAYTEWLDYKKSGVNNLQDKKIKEGWYIAYIWHTTVPGIWHTNWIFARNLPINNKI